MNAKTRRRILETAAALDYRANSAAQTLALAKTNALALLLPDLANPSASAITAGAEERALASGYLLLVATGSIADRLPALTGRVDGVIIASATSGALPALGRDDSRIPMLLVNRREAWPMPSIILNDEEGARMAVEHLAMLGHTRIGHIAGPQNSDTGRRRRRGFELQMRAAGFELRPEWIAEGTYNEAGGEGAARRILTSKTRPTALLVSNLLATVGAMSAARRLGLNLPRDLSLITFDDLPLARYVDPPVTTVRLPLGELGRQAVDSLVAMIRGQDVTDAIIESTPELVVRRSTVPPAR